MNIKLILYIVTSMLSVYALSGVNFNGIFKIKKEIEARVLVIILSLSMAYLLTNFINDFLIVSKIM